MTTLYLVRHGETVANAAQILQGWQGGELNETGKAQAHDVAEKMRNERIDVFVASDLRRAIQTCTIIASAKGVNQEGIVTTPLLRERDWGSFTGKFIPDLENVEWPDDVESLEHMKSRAQNFFDMGKDYLSQQGCARSWPWHHKQGNTEHVFQEADERNTQDAQCGGKNPYAVNICKIMRVR